MRIANSFVACSYLYGFISLLLLSSIAIGLWSALSISVPAVVGVKVLICFLLLTQLCAPAQDDFFSVMAVFYDIKSSCFNF